MKIANILIVHYTYGWTQDLIESWEKYLPDRKLIVFNNNPIPDQLVEDTRGGLGNNLFINNLCQKELKYLYKKNIIDFIIDLPNQKNKKIKKLMTHGQCMDFIFNYCHKMGYEYLLHVEPDCVVHGDRWINLMLNKIKQNWLVGYGDFKENKDNFVMQMCPTLWNIQKTLNLVQEKKISFEKSIKKNMNTGQEIMKEFLYLKKCCVVNSTFDFFHFYDGTKKLHKKSKIKLF